MPTSGSPPWLRTVVFTDYGGHANKRNYGGRGVVDPRTDIDAGQVQRMASDLASITRVMPFASLRILPNGTGVPTVYYAKVGPVLTSGSYTGDAPPAGMPTVTRSNTGVFIVDFPATYTDESGATAAFGPIMAAASIASSTGIGTASAYISAGNVYVYTYDVSGSPAASDSFPFVVEVW